MPRLAFLIIIIIGYTLQGTAFGGMLTVEADEVQKTGPRIEAKGNVVLTGEGATLKADYIVYDTSTEDIWATGDCSLKEEKGEVIASSLYYNATRKDMHLENGWVLIYAEPMKISGQSISRYGEDYYTGDSVEYTRCLGIPPDWSLKIKDLEIPVEGYAKAKDVRFTIDSLPVLWFPYLLYPAKLKRQSGILFPEINHSSDYGTGFGLPLYIVLGRSLDLTLTPMYLSQRGLLMKNEVNYCIDYEQAGSIYVETLHDRMGGDKSQGGSVQPEIPEDRWFFKAEQNGGNLTWDVNLVSNPDYFRDIGTFYGSSYSITGATQGLATFNDSSLEELISRAQWVNSGSGISVAVSGQWKQNLLVENNGQTLQELPKLSARLRERTIPYTPLRVSSEISSIRVYSTDWIDAMKDHGEIEVSWPLELNPYFTLRPYTGNIYRDTFFTETEGIYPDSSYAENWQRRGASLSTTFYSRRFGDSWYHQVIPEIIWEYQSRYGGNYSPQDPDDFFPDLLTGDDWQKTFNMQLSLANYIRDSTGYSLADVYATWTYSYIEDRWENIDARVNIQPVSWLKLSHTNTLEREPKRPYATQENSTKLTLMDKRGDELYVAEEYTRENTKLLKVGTKAELIGGFSAGFATEYDYLQKIYQTSQQSISYNSQCWIVEVLRYAESSADDSPRKTTWALTMRLLGLGDIRTSRSMRGSVPQ